MIGEIGTDGDTTFPDVDGAVELDGLLHREDVRARTGITLPAGHYDTLAGFVVTRMGHTPRIGDSVVALGRRAGSRCSRPTGTAPRWCGSPPTRRSAPGPPSRAVGPCAPATGPVQSAGMTASTLPPRTDDEIRTAVIQELAWSPGTGSGPIDVAVSSGAVTLSGQVDSYPERLRAGSAAQRVRGVLGVAQEITVRGSWDAVTDTEIARESGLALRRSVDVPDAVKVAVHDRVVTLSGAVAWQYQRQAATYAVQYLPGVASVSNLIEVRPEIEPAGIGPAIRAALVRRAEVEAAHVDVDVEGGVVTLTGTVLTWAERRAVEDACWSGPGVAVVENKLRITG